MKTLPLRHAVIGLAGPIGVGKSTAGKMLAERYGMRVLPFAAPIKRAAAEVFGLTPEWLQDDHKNLVHPYWGITPRQMFVGVGETLKDTFGTDLWIKRWTQEVKNWTGPILVDDVRATKGGEHEAQAIRAMGGLVIHMAGPQRREVPTNVNYGTTEDPLPQRDGDRLVLNVGSLYELSAELEAAIHD
jgi:hypothetical protein